MSEYSILRGITRADIRHEPYAHVVVEGCLPARLYAELARTFPADETILRLGRSTKRRRAKPNSRHDVGARCILQNPDCSSRHWQEFVRYHVSNSFYREFIELMGQEIMAAYPELERRLGRPLCELRTGILDTPEAADCDVALDCHIGINTAVIFINSASALHAVSARSASLVSRRLVNIMGRMPRSIPEGLFEKRQKRDLLSLGRRALQRYRSASGRF
jgi:hypothetical protein